MDVLASLLCDAYLQVDVLEQQSVRQMLAEDALEGVWTGMSAKFFAMSRWQSNARQIVRGLTALAIDDLRYDTRNTVLLLAVGRHCADALQADFEQACAEVLAVSTKEFARLVRGFLALPAEQQTIQYKGVREVVTPSGVWYELFRN